MSMSEARKAWAELLDRVEAGEQVTITRHGRRVAVVSPPPSWEERLSPATAENLALLNAARGMTPTRYLSIEQAEELVAAIRADRDSD